MIDLTTYALLRKQITTAASGVSDVRAEGDELVFVLADGHEVRVAIPATEIRDAVVRDDVLVLTLENDKEVVVDATLTQSGQAADAKATGEAVGQLKDDLTNELGWAKVVPEIIDGGYYIISNDGKLKFISSTSWSYAKLNVFGHDGVKITVSTYITSGTPVIFIGDDDAVLEKYYGASGNPNILNTTTTTIPDGTRSIIINVYAPKRSIEVSGNLSGLKSYVTEIKYKAEKNSDDIVSIEKSIEGIEKNTKNIGETISAFIKRTNNIFDPKDRFCGYINKTGILFESASFLTTGFIEVNYPNTVRFTGAVRIVFFDSDKNVLSYIGEDLNTPIGTAADLPEGTAYVRVCWLSNNDIKTASKKTVYLSDKDEEFQPFEVIDKDYIEKDESTDIDIGLMLSNDIYVCEGKEININHQSVLVGFDATKAVLSGSLQNVRSNGLLTTIKGGEVYGIKQYRAKPTSEYITKDINIHTVSETSGSGVTKKVLFIGDSKTDANVYTQKLLDMFVDDPMNIQLIGTRGNTDTNRHEGRSGWSARMYVTNEWERGVVDDSPFFNPTTQNFDFGYYMTNNGYNDVDYVFICLGTNDARDTMIQYYHEMIDGIKAYNPNVIIGIWVPAPFATFGGYTHVDNDNQTFKAMKLILDEFDTVGNQNNGIYVVPTHININTYYDFGWKDVRYNDVCTDTYRVCTDQIHEVNGYGHVADVIFGYIKYFATLN